MITAQDLQGKGVVSAADGKQLGEVKECVCDLAKGTIIGLLVDASVRLLGEQAVATKDIVVIGDDAILVKDESSLVEPVEVPGLDDLARPAEAPPMAVLTKTGKRLGHLGRIVIDREKKKVVGYEVSGGPLRELTEGTPLLPIMDGVVHGEDTILVPADAAELAHAEAGALGRMWQALTEQVGRVRERVEHAADRAERAVRDAATKREPPKPTAEQPGAAKPAAKKPAARKPVAKTAKKAPKKAKRARS
jgi:uncharacterized protein YrrD